MTNLFKSMGAFYTLSLIFFHIACGPGSFSPANPTQPPIISQQQDSLITQDTTPLILRFNLEFYIDEYTNKAIRLKETQVVMYEDGTIMLLSQKDSLSSPYNTLNRLSPGSHTIKDGIHTVSYLAVYKTPSIFKFIEEVPTQEIIYQLDSEWKLIRLKIGDRIYYSDTTREADIKVGVDVKPTYHMVQVGQTLGWLLRKYNMSAEQLKTLNKEDEKVLSGIRKNVIYAGTKIRVR